MKKENSNIEQILVTRGLDSKDLPFQLESIRAAALNSTSVKKMQVAIPTINPRDIYVGDEIYMIKAVPVDSESKEIDAPLQLGHIAMEVDTLSRVNKPGYITINGSIDIPVEPSVSSNILNCIFTNKEVCKAVVQVLANFEYERAMAIYERAQKVAQSLEDQIAAERF